MDTVALIGYGEVGKILAEDLRARDLEVHAWDRDLDAARGQAMHRHAALNGVALAGSATAAVSGADLVISVVTASQTVHAAGDCAPGLRANAFFLDLNSASPVARTQAAARIDAAGGRYVEGVVMTSVPPYRIRVPLLLGGAHAAALEGPLQTLGFHVRASDSRLGVASATKLCRSVMIKGLEALVLESLTAARHYGVEDAVLLSLRESFPGIDWEGQASYFFQRTIEHGRRRSEEMREAARSVTGAGLEPWSASATAERQGWMADLASAGCFGARGELGYARSADWRVEADRILGCTPGAR